MVKTPEVQRVVEVAKASADLPEPILFVGGSVVGLWATASRAPAPRATDDVGLVAFVADYAQRATLYDRLRQRGFSEDGESLLPRLASLRTHSDCEVAVEGHLANDTPDQVAVVRARIDAILA